MHRRRDKGRLTLAALAPALLASAIAAPAAAGAPQQFVPGQIVVKYRAGTAPAARAAAQRAAGASVAQRTGHQARVLRIEPGTNMRGALQALRARSDVEYAVPNYLARAADFVPNDPGREGPGDWQKLQWNFAGPAGVNAPGAWSNLIAEGVPGAQGATVALLDTGVAYENRRQFRRSPDFTSDQFVTGFDFLANNRHPDDRNGHGTLVAGIIAEKTDNEIGLTGLAYNAKIMPVRVLNSQGDGDAATIAKGIRYAVRRGVRVINLSLVFSTGISRRKIPQILSALRDARRSNVVVVAAAGNDGAARIAYPARSRDTVSVGATTEHLCVADYSNGGPGLDIVAPGGGADARIEGDPHCRPGDAPGRNIFQVTFDGSGFRHFGIPKDYQGTSMASPHVAAGAAMVIASGVLGPNPSAQAVIDRLKATAQPLGPPGSSATYGAGLLDVAAATAPGGAPPAPAPTPPPTPTPAAPPVTPPAAAR